MMEDHNDGTHWGQTISLPARTTLTNVPILSLLSYIRCYSRYLILTDGNSIHPILNCREELLGQKLVATMNTFTMANGSCLRKAHVYRKLCPSNCPSQCLGILKASDKQFMQFGLAFSVICTQCHVLYFI